MIHATLDCYGANTHQLDDIKHINDLLNSLCYTLDLNPITPPQLIPYYYGKVKDDLGISAFVFLDGGHATIHTFPLRECYFVDILCNTDTSIEKITDFFKKELPFKEDLSFINLENRSVVKNEILEYDPASDFGPHLMSKLQATTIPTMESFFEFLETMVEEIHMDPISRAYLIKSPTTNSKYLSGLIVIAQSHIALHYNYETNEILADIFSCAPFDYRDVNKYFKKLGTITSNSLIARGTKHIYKVKSKIDNLDLMKSTKWQKTVKNK